MKDFVKPRERVQLFCSGPSRTHQSFKAECEIANVLAKHARTGMLEHVNKFDGQYGDYLDVQSFQDSLNQVMAAEEMFLSLSSAVRKRFNNDPGYFLSFVGDPTNQEEMINLGLAIRRPEPVPTSTESSDS